MMPRTVLVGIDLGTTALKAAAFDARTGRLLAAASERLPVRTGADGMREQSLATIDRALGRAARSLRRKLGRAWDRVAGLGLAAQGGSAAIVNRASGKPLTPMQLWSDTRPLGLLPGIARRKAPGYWRRLSGMDGPGAGLARMKWLRARHPKIFCDENLYVGAGEHAYFRLTGVWRQDAGSAIQIGCYDVKRRHLAAAPLALVGVPLPFVASLREGHAKHPLSRQGAKRLGLAEGLPVAGPYFDHEAGYLSAVGASHRPLQCSLGTAWVGNFVVRRGAPPAGGLQLVLPSPAGTGSLVTRVMRAGNASWDWALAALVDADPKKALAKAERIFRKRLLPPEGLVCLPHLTRPNRRAPEVTGDGAFLGVGAHASREDLLRALASGMAFEFARVFELLRRRGRASCVVLGGGASKGWYFRTLLAALFDPLPVVYPEEEDLTGARGALYALSRRTARARTRHVRRPSKSLCAEVARRYARYCEAAAAAGAGKRRRRR